MNEIKEYQDLQNINTDKICDNITKIDFQWKNIDEINIKVQKYIESEFLNKIKVYFNDDELTCSIEILETKEIFKEEVGDNHYGLLNYIINEQQTHCLEDFLYKTKEKLLVICVKRFLVNDYSQSFCEFKELTRLIYPSFIEDEYNEFDDFAKYFFDTCVEYNVKFYDDYIDLLCNWSSILERENDNTTEYEMVVRHTLNDNKNKRQNNELNNKQ